MCFLAGVEVVAVGRGGFHGELGYGVGVGEGGAAEGHAYFAEFGPGGAKLATFEPTA